MVCHDCLWSLVVKVSFCGVFTGSCCVFVYFFFHFFWKSQNLKRKSQRGAIKEYKTKKKNIFTLGNVKYQESSRQLPYTRLNDETIISNVVFGSK